MSKIWFTSDPHFMHRNISGPSRSAWDHGYRDFGDEIEMSHHIVKVWNETVAEDDILYCLGDWSFQGKDNIWNFRKQLNCKTIHLILGNHDEHIRKNSQIQIPHEECEEWNSLANVSAWSWNSRIVNTQDMFTSVNEVATVKHGKNTFFLSHYSHRIWEGSHKGIIHLYGHSHDTIEDYGKSMDVGVDVAKRLLNAYRPFSMEEILDIMSKRNVELVDHHNEKTNIK